MNYELEFHFKERELTDEIEAKLYASWEDGSPCTLNGHVGFMVDVQASSLGEAIRLVFLGLKSQGLDPLNFSMGLWGAEEMFAAMGAPSSETQASMNTPQPAPTQTEETPVWELVVEDMQERDRAGRQKYGTPLQASNGRNHLVDAYQEALDLTVYLRAALEALEGSDAL